MSIKSKYTVTEKLYIVLLSVTAGWEIINIQMFTNGKWSMTQLEFSEKCSLSPPRAPHIQLLYYFIAK